MTVPSHGISRCARAVSLVRLDGPPLKEVGMGTAVSRSILPQPLINMVNPVVRPLHSVLDRALLVLHVVGRKTSHSTT
jgi:hypothetical protein